MNKIRHHYMLLATAVITFMAAAFTSCSDDKDEYGEDALSISAVVPSKVIAGQEIAITGTGLGNVTSVTFPGGVRVTEFTKVAEGMLYVVTPAGIDPQGGTITVDNGDATVTSRVSLTIGSPSVTAASPVDEVAKINDQVQAYGTDLEFISQALFPGADGTPVAVAAADFRRKSTSALSIPVPHGIAAGPAQITLVDCSGKQYQMPVIELSDEISGGSEVSLIERTTLWDAGYDGSWTFLDLRPADLNFGFLTPNSGQQLKFVFENTAADSRFCICLGESWAKPDLGGENDPNNVSIANAKEFIVPLTDEFLNEVTNGIMHIGGVNFRLTKIVLMDVPGPLWEGEQLSGWWWNCPTKDLMLSGAEAKKGGHLKFTFKDHDVDQNFYLYDGVWGAYDVDGPGVVNIVMHPGENEIIVEITEGGALCINGTPETEVAFIIGGEVVITKIEIVD